MSEDIPKPLEAERENAKKVLLDLLNDKQAMSDLRTTIENDELPVRTMKKFGLIIAQVARKKELERQKAYERKKESKLTDEQVASIFSSLYMLLLSARTLPEAIGIVKGRFNATGYKTPKGESNIMQGGIRPHANPDFTEENSFRFKLGERENEELYAILVLHEKKHVIIYKWAHEMREKAKWMPIAFPE